MSADPRAADVQRLPLAHHLDHLARRRVDLPHRRRRPELPVSAGGVPLALLANALRLQPFLPLLVRSRSWRHRFTVRRLDHQGHRRISTKISGITTPRTRRAAKLRRSSMVAPYLPCTPVIMSFPLAEATASSAGHKRDPRSIPMPNVPILLAWPLELEIYALACQVKAKYSLRLALAGQAEGMDLSISSQNLRGVSAAAAETEFWPPTRQVCKQAICRRAQQRNNRARIQYDYKNRILCL